MNIKRIQEIQSKTAYPDSVSVQQALLQVWRETNDYKVGKGIADEIDKQVLGDVCKQMGINTSPTFTDGLSKLLNSHSMENASNTPDFILAEYMKSCLDAYNKAVTANTKWQA